MSKGDKIGTTIAMIILILILLGDDFTPIVPQVLRTVLKTLLT